MKIIIIFCIVLCLVVSINISATDEKESKGARTILRLASTPLQWNLPVEGTDFQKTQTSSGVTFYLKRDAAVPLIQINCYVRAGSLFETGLQSQVARVTALMLRECGSRKMSVERMDALLDYYAGELSIECQHDLVHITASIPSRQTDTLVNILAGLLSQPAFKEEKLAYVARRMEQKEAAAAEDPYYLCRRKFYQVVYSGHPYSTLYCAGGVKQVTLDQVADYFDRFYFPQNIFVLVTGDFDEESLVKEWEKHYQEYPENKEYKKPVVVEPVYRPGVYLLHKDINQTSIYFGMQGVGADTPDIYGIHLLNHMVGGSSFASRFTQEVRDKEGLAYRVGSIFETDLMGRGAFIARCRTKTRSTVRALDAMLWILELFRENRISKHEFEVGRDGLKNGFVKQFATVEDVLKNFLTLDFLGRPQSYLSGYQEEVQSVSQQQLTKMARKYLDPSKMAFVVVGNVHSMEDKLKKFGKIYHLTDSGVFLPKDAKEKLDEHRSKMDFEE